MPHPATGRLNHADTGPEDVGRRRLGRRRLVALVAFAAVLLVQGAWSFGTKPEPYPTVRMPGFGNAATAEGLFPKRTLDVVIHYEDGSQTQVRAAELIPVRPSSARPALEQVFWPNIGGERTAEDPELRTWLVERARGAAEHHSDPVALVLHRCEVDIDIRTAIPVGDGECDVERLQL